MKKILEKFKDKKVALIGDIFLDRYRITDVVHGYSREADIPVLRFENGKESHKDEYSPGAGGTIAWNLASLGAKVFVFGAIGNDYNGMILRKELEKRSINTKNLLTIETRSTSTYEKSYDVKDVSKPIQRWDAGNVLGLNENDELKLLESLKNNLDSFDALLVVDQNEVGESNGIITKSLLETIATLKIKTYGMSRNRISEFKNFYCLIPNDNELMRATETYTPKNFDEEIPLEKVREASKIFLENTQSEKLVVTIGKNGAFYFDKTQQLHISTTPLEGTLDTTGCGDTFLATLVLSNLAGANDETSIKISNISAGITAKKLGTTGATTPEELIKNLNQNKLGE